MNFVDNPNESLYQKIKEHIGVNTCTAHKYIHFTTYDVVLMGSSDTPSTDLTVQTLTETLKKEGLVTAKVGVVVQVCGGRFSSL